MGKFTTKVSNIEYRVSNQIQVSINIVRIMYRTSTSKREVSTGIPHDPYILPYRLTPRPSSQTDTPLQHYQCRTIYFKCSFFPQTILAWNALPKSVVTSSTLDAFKVALGRPKCQASVLEHQPFLFLVLQPILSQLHLVSFGFTFLLSCFYLLHCIFSFLLIYHVQTPAISLTH